VIHRDEEVRPYFGESQEVLHGPSFAAPDTMPRATFQQRHDAFVAEGLCPACKVDLDDAGFCSMCGFDRDRDQLPDTPELRDDYIPQLPIPLEEFSPAAVDEAA